MLDNKPSFLSPTPIPTTIDFKDVIHNCSNENFTFEVKYCLKFYTSVFYFYISKSRVKINMKWMSNVHPLTYISVKVGDLKFQLKTSK